jgi:hypothetical protein
MCVWSKWMFATWNPGASYDLAVRKEQADTHVFSVVNQLGALVSPDRGILVWTPVVLLLVPAVVRSWGELPDWSRALLMAGLAYNVVQGCLGSFTGGFLFYGYRYGITFVVCATPALALAAPRMGAVARRLLGPVVGVQLLAFAMGSVFDNLWLDKADVWRANAFFNALLVLGGWGWGLVALFAALGVVGNRVWRHFIAPEARTEQLLATQAT